MASSRFIFLCLLGALVVSNFVHGQYQYQFQQQELCDSWSCSVECSAQGVHGDCDSNDSCRCLQCIQPACKKYCRRQQRRIGQCDNGICQCL